MAFYGLLLGICLLAVLSALYMAHQLGAEETGLAHAYGTYHDIQKAEMFGNMVQWYSGSGGAWNATSGFYSAVSAAAKADMVDMRVANGILVVTAGFGNEVVYATGGGMARG